MRFANLGAIALLLAFGASPVLAQDEDRIVEDGGVFVEGWQGTIDAPAAAQGQSIDQARFESAEGGAGFHVITGPASTYWNTGERLSGNYTVRATFTEPEYMNLNNHPHPYGIVIAGNDMGTSAQRYLYCAAYGNGRFIARGFGPEPFQLNGRGEEHPAVNQAPDRNEPVTQEIAVSVRDGAVSCEINGTVVATYPADEVMGEGRLTSTDGHYGIRAAHNTEVMITDLTVTRE